MKIAAIIPAHLASVRFPRKILFPFHGLPMIEHIRRRALLSDSVSDVYVATCDDEIAEAVSGYGGKVIITANTHTNGTSRVAEAVEDIDCTHVMLLQGDEPLLPPEAIQQALNPLLSDNNISLGTLKTRVTNVEEMLNPHIVKVVTDCDDYALYFSRSPIPYLQHKPNALFCFRHIEMVIDPFAILLIKN